MALIKGRAGAVKYDLDTAGTTYTVTFSALTVDTTRSAVALPGNATYAGQALLLTAATPPTGLTTTTTYYVLPIPGDSQYVRLCANFANFLAGTFVTISAVGSGSGTLVTSDVVTLATDVQSWMLDLSYGTADATVLNSTVERKVKTVQSGSGSFTLLANTVGSNLAAAASAPNNDGLVQLTLITDITTGRGFQFAASLLGYKTGAKPTDVQTLEVGFSVFSEIVYV